MNHLIQSSLTAALDLDLLDRRERQALALATTLNLRFLERIGETGKWPFSPRPVTFGSVLHKKLPSRKLTWLAGNSTIWVDVFHFCKIVIFL